MNEFERLTIFLLSLFGTADFDHVLPGVDRVENLNDKLHSVDTTVADWPSPKNFSYKKKISINVLCMYAQTRISPDFIRSKMKKSAKM